MAIAPEQLDALRPHLLRFAQLQLRDPALAEDVVADTVLAVLEHPERFAGNASLKTYVIGILKHKIIDAIRSGRREVRVSLLAGGASDDADLRSDEAVFDTLFAVDGHYLTPPSDWGTRMQCCRGANSSTSCRCAWTACRRASAVSS